MFRKSFIALAVVAFCANASAAVSADEAKQLGTTLTPVVDEATNTARAQEVLAAL